MTIECQYCRRPELGACQLISRHTTSEGVQLYVRCACGRLQTYLVSNAELRSWFQPTHRPAPAPAFTAA